MEVSQPPSPATSPTTKMFWPYTVVALTAKDAPAELAGAVAPTYSATASPAPTVAVNFPSEPTV